DPDVGRDDGEFRFGGARLVRRGQHRATRVLSAVLSLPLSLLLSSVSGGLRGAPGRGRSTGADRANGATGAGVCGPRPGTGGGASAARQRDPGRSGPAFATVGRSQ